MEATRNLLVIADDYGIGPETSRGILELADRGVVTGAVLMVNSPHAADAVRCWRSSGTPLELGWHPCLTMDAPIAPIARVPNLVRPDGTMWPLGPFLKRLLLGHIPPVEIEAELRAQYARFLDLVGSSPMVVNSHQHVSLFGPVGNILLDVLSRWKPLPYLRAVREPYGMLLRIRGARIKRAVLNWCGRRHARKAERAGFPGPEWLAGITDPAWVRDPQFFARWLTRIPGRTVELACHPGYWDDTLVGRDCKAGDGLQQRRVDELHLLKQPTFLEACTNAGFVRIQPGQLRQRLQRGCLHAA
jgi:predicted glycoside hydrolase/deacetylase ChbG (UPF0249 family)